MKTITPKQRITALKLWAEVAADRGWKTSDRQRRLDVVSELVGRPVQSLNEVGRLDEYTRLLNGLRAMLGTDLDAAREADDPWPNRGRVLLHQIVTDLVPGLEEHIADVRRYIAAISHDRREAWGLAGLGRDIDLTDLSCYPYRDARGEHPSPLRQMRDTLAARLAALRRRSPAAPPASVPEASGRIP